MLEPAEYLAGLASSRALYLLLYRGAVELLPAPSDPAAVGLLPLESRATLAELARELELGMSVVKADLTRLVRYRWVRDRRMPRHLGHREGAIPYLLADIAAEEATGELGLVSRLVLRLEAPEAHTRRERGSRGQAPELRGTNRTWRGQGEW